MTTNQHLIKRWLLRVPMPSISLLVGVVCGLLVWLLLDPIQTRDLGEGFHREQIARQQFRAVDSRRRFEHFMEQIQAGLYGLTRDWRMIDYLENDLANELIPKDQSDTENWPSWLDPNSPFINLVNPILMAIVDADGTSQTVFRIHDHPFPIDLAMEQFAGRRHAVLTTLWEAPYFIAWEKVPDLAMFDDYYLMIVVPIGEKVLLASQQQVPNEETLVGLFDADTRSVYASSDIGKVGTAMKLDQIVQTYQSITLSMTRFISPENNIQFYMLVPKANLKERFDRLMGSVRRARLVDAVVYISAFTLVFFLISSRLSYILRRISMFSQVALGADSPRYQEGNQLILLEDRLVELFKQFRTLRDESQVEHENRIQETETFKARLLDNAMDSIITIDHHGLIVEANSTAEKTFGFKREHVYGKRLDALLIHTNERQAFRELLNRCRSVTKDDPGCRAQRMLGIDLNGLEKPLEISVMAFQLKDQLLTTVYLRDITQREKADLQIKSLANFAKENPSPVLRINNRGVITYANLASDPLLDYWDCERGQTLPLYWRNLVFKALGDCKNREYEVTIEERIFSVLMAPVIELDYVNLFGRDITQVKNAEQQSRQHQSELVHVCRLSTMGEMATGLAHELNQPLSAIVNFASGCVRRLQAGIGGEAELVDAMAQITLQAERASEIIKRLRTLVSKRPQEHTLANINHLVLEVASFVEYEANRYQIETEIDLAEDGLPAMVDLVQIEQVLLNLVRNAIDALKQVDIDQRHLTLKTHRIDDHHIEVIVKDSGPGITSDNLAHLFDSFFSTKETGMGMGLAISRKIIEAHHGELKATSEFGQGAVFMIVLPTNPELELPGI